jgi:hypothetical protein
MIDPATSWFEIQQYDDKQFITVANIVEQEWFSRYPWPRQITFDRGSEFIGQDFQKMINKDYAIKAKPIPEDFWERVWYVAYHFILALLYCSS